MSADISFFSGCSSPLSPGEQAHVQALAGNPVALRRRVVRLEERVRRREAEAKELRKVVATKDAVIRDLGVNCEAAQEAEHALETKDDIIRSLGASQGQAEEAARALETKDDIIRKLARPGRGGAGLLASSSTSSLVADGPDRQAPPNPVPFSVAPVSWDDVAHRPAPGSLVDWRIAAFSNSRRLKVLFARVDDHDNYLYGRMPVRCLADDDGASEAGVRVATAGLLTDNYLFALEEFVSVFEDAEYQSCTMELSRAGWLAPPPPPAEPVAVR